MIFIKELNNDQLNGLASLCFDLAKGSFLVALFPTVEITTKPFLSFMMMLMGLFLGLVFTYIALLLLRLKEVGK